MFDTHVKAVIIQCLHACMCIKLVADCNIHLKLIGFGHALGEVHLSTD